jgi:hypothetical protein
MAVGDNTFLYFENLGGAGPGERTINVGEFTLDLSAGTSITVNEGAGGGDDDVLTDAASGGGVFSITDDQFIVGGPFDGLEVTVITRRVVEDEFGNEVGFVYDIAADQDGDGSAHEINEIFGFILAGDFVDGQTYTPVGGYAPHEVPAGATYADLVCFAAGTLIETENGPMAIEDLSQDDLVVTQDRGLRPIRWIGKKELSSANLEANEKLRPVRIKAGALSEALPTRDLVVSRQHRMLASSKIAKRMFGSEEVLISAIKLTALPDIAIETELKPVTYYHLLFDQHEIIFAEGAPTESLHTGPEALKTLSSDALSEIFTLFPELAYRSDARRPVRTIPPAKQQRKFVSRTERNKHQLL